MNLQILGSGSSGNSYLLKSEKDILVIDAGVSFQKVKEAVNFQISNIVGVLVSHAHL
jgi:phosphoribosyl 1,2-cyclic phosphodiesterase